MSNISMLNLLKDDGTSLSPKNDREFIPQATDGAALGSATVMWSDLFLASGAVINFDNGNVTLTHAANVLTVDTGATSGAGMVFDVEDLTTGDGVYVNGTANNLTTGSLVKIESDSTAGTGSDNSKMLEITRSGANANATHKSYGIYAEITNTGTTNTNCAFHAIATGASSHNYCFHAEGGTLFLEPNATVSQKAIEIVPTTAVTAGTDWDAIYIDGDALDPLTGAFTTIHGIHCDFSGVLSAQGDDAVTGGTYMLCPTGDTATSWGHAHVVTEMTVDGTQIGFGSLGDALELDATATYRGVWIDWDEITQGTNAPVLEGMRVELPASYTNFGTSFAAYFSGGGENVTFCDGTYSINTSSAVTLGATTLGGTLTLGGNNITGASNITAHTATELDLIASDTVAGIRMYTTDDAGPTSTLRLTLSGTVDTAVATWADITHTGLVMSGTLDVAAQNITMTGAISDTTNRVSKLWATAIEVTNEAGLTIGGNAISTIYAALGANSDITSLSGLTTDLTIAQGGTGASTLAGASIPTYTSTITFTNKRITPRVTTEASSATPTINTDNTDMHSITALATAITNMTTNLSGTPTNGQKLLIRILDNGTGRAIDWDTGFEDNGVALPTTTTANKLLTVGFIYDTANSKFGCVAVADET